MPGPKPASIKELKARGTWRHAYRTKERLAKSIEGRSVERIPCPHSAADVEQICRTAIPFYDPWSQGAEFTFDADEALRRVAWFWDVASHVKGQFAWKCFALEPWEVAIVGNLFGWTDAAGLRRYREAYCSVARKNGKTLLGAGIALQAFLLDDEPGAECYSCAAEREQAALAFDVAKNMVAREPSLEHIKCYQRSIVDEADFRSYKPISAQAHSKHGYNPHFVLSDELHAHNDRELIDVLQSAQGARSQPLMFHITTAGHDRETICWEKYVYAQRVRDNEVHDPRFLPAIWEMPESDDWHDETLWHKANPNLGVSVSVEFLQGECAKAKAIPAYETTFRNLYLNQWVSVTSRWLPMHDWDECAKRLRGDLGGQVCYAGLDLASTRDTCSLVLVFPADDGTVDVVPYFWLPEQNIDRKEQEDRVPYRLWERQGLIELTPGSSTDYDYIRDCIVKASQRYDLRMVGVDPYNARHLLTQLRETYGMREQLVEVRQGAATLNAPMKRLEGFVLEHKIRHGGHPILRWQADCVQVKFDENENARPVKNKSRGRIDGIVALIMGFLMMTESEGVVEEYIWSFDPAEQRVEA